MTLTEAFYEQSRILMQFSLRTEVAMKSLQWMAASLSFLLWAGLASSSAQAGIGSGQAVGGGGRGVITIQTTVGSPSSIKGRPYSADVVHESNRVLADGNRIHTETHGKVFRDSEGRTRNEYEFDLGGVKRTNVTVLDPVAQIHITLDLENKIATLHHLRSRASSVADHVPTQVPSTVETSSRPVLTSEDLGSKEIEGLVALGTRTVRTFEAGSVGNERPFTSVNERWFSRELSILLVSGTDDPRSGQNTMRLINIQRGEPDPQLFQVPPDYSVKDIPEKQ